MASKWRWSVALVAVMLLAVAGAAQGAAPNADGVTVPYSGRLTGEAGEAVADGPYDLKFTLYAAATGGEPLWSETQTGVAVRGGAFGVALGSLSPIPKETLAGGRGWLEVSVRGPGDAAFTPLSPRQQLSTAQGAASPNAALSCAHTHFGEYWPGSTSSGHGLSVDNSTGTGDGIRGYTDSAGVNDAGVYAVNYSSGPGIWGQSAGGGPGVTGVGNFGVSARGNDASLDDTAGDILLQGNYGEILATGNVLALTSNRDVFVTLDYDNNSAASSFAIFGGTGPAIWWVSETTGVVTTGSQASAVKTSGDGQRLMYAVEGTGVWLEDVGTAALGDGGESTIAFDPVYAEAAALGQEYQVFVTAQGDGPVLLYVSAKTPLGFTVRGVTLDGKPASCAFDYRVVAPRAGYEKVRMEKYTPQVLGKEGP